jgi:hypothetical protein
MEGLSAPNLEDLEFLFKIIRPLDELSSLRHKGLICSVISVRVPSLRQRLPVLRCLRLALILPSQLQYLHCPEIAYADRAVRLRGESIREISRTDRNEHSNITKNWAKWERELHQSQS